MNTNRHLTAEDWDAIKAKHAAMTPDEARAWIRKVTGPPRRQLDGEERDSVLLILSLKEPVSSSNNQRTWTDVYEHNGKEYHVTSFPGGVDEVDEMLPDD